VNFLWRAGVEEPACDEGRGACRWSSWWRAGGVREGSAGWGGECVGMRVGRWSGGGGRGVRVDR